MRACEAGIPFVYLLVLLSDGKGCESRLYPRHRQREHRSQDHDPGGQLVLTSGAVAMLGEKARTFDAQEYEGGIVGFKLTEEPAEAEAPAPAKAPAKKTGGRGRATRP